MCIIIAPIIHHTAEGSSFLYLSHARHTHLDLDASCATPLIPPPSTAHPCKPDPAHASPYTGTGAGTGAGTGTGTGTGPVVVQACRIPIHGVPLPNVSAEWAGLCSLRRRWYGCRLRRYSGWLRGSWGSDRRWRCAMWCRRCRSVCSCI